MDLQVCTELGTDMPLILCNLLRQENECRLLLPCPPQGKLGESGGMKVDFGRKEKPRVQSLSSPVQRHFTCESDHLSGG